MSNVVDYYTYAALATAAYVRMGGKSLDGATFADEAASLAQGGGRLPSAQATSLFNPADASAPRWDVLSYYGGDAPEFQADRSGFGATVFQHSATGEKVLALRGTEPSEDNRVDLLSADLGQIGLFGIALTQVVSLANYVMRLKASSGVFVPQLRVEATLVQPTSGFYLEAAKEGGGFVYLKIEQGPQMAGLDILQPGDLVRLTGHSLGGHLAVMAARLFPDVFSSNVVVFNAAGYDPTSANVLGFLEQWRSYFFPSFLFSAFVGVVKSRIADEIGDAANQLATAGNLLSTQAILGINTLLGRPATQGTPAVQSVRSEDLAPGDDTSLVASALTGADKYGGWIDLPTENNNHVIEPFMDALALQAAIDPLRGTSFDTNALTRVLQASANKNARSYEELTEALSRLFIKGATFLDENGEPKAEHLPTSDESSLSFTGKGLIGQRNAFHDAVLQLQSAINDASEPALLTNIADMPGSELRSFVESAGAFSYRYALKALNPFAVVAADSFYGPHNLEGDLNRYDPAATPRGGMTDQYINDRVPMWVYANTVRTQDVSSLTDATIAQSTLYEDRGTNLKFSVLRVGEQEIQARRVAFGSDSADGLAGTVRADQLYGAAGTDVLDGKQGDDYLEGGRGLDIYQFGAQSLFGIPFNDGNDTILDVDGKGVLRYSFLDGTFAFGTRTSTVIIDASVKDASGNTWFSADGKFKYERIGNDLKVTITGDAGGTLLLKDFRDGDFGIRLWEPRTAPQFAPTENIVEGGDDENNSLTGTAAADLIQAFGGNDVANGGVGDDLVEGGMGNDVLDGQGDNDRLFGDAGEDNVTGGLGDDEVHGGADRDFVSDAGGTNLLEGNAGADIVYAFGLGRDELYGDAKVDLSAAILAGEQAGSGLKGDWLMAGADDDLAVGGAGNDVLMGGGANDILVGGAGDDNITGDRTYVATTFDWEARREILPQPDGSTVYSLIFTPAAELAVTPAGNDVIYAGSGVDWVLAGDGDDFIDAGSGDDVVWGEAASDVLVGGAGNDLLVGDNPGVVTGAAEGGDYLDGGAGDDTLHGNGGADVLIGGAGVDVLVGGAGKDIYVFNKGDGTETVFDDDASSSSADASVLVLGDGVSRSDIKFRTGSLAVDLGPIDPSDPNSPRDVIHFEGFDQVNPTNSTPLGEIQFADGTSMSYDEILSQGFDVDGTEEDDDGHDAAHPQLVGTGVVDRIRGFGGNDVLAGLAGDDVLDGGAGDDQLQGWSGTDSLQGGDGNDVLFGDVGDATEETSGNDVLDGGAGFDFLAGNAGDDTLLGGDDGDNLQGQTGADVIEGGAGDDFLYGDGIYDVAGVLVLNAMDDDAADTLRGGDGNDELNSAGGDDLLEGGAGNDLLFAEDGNDTLLGGDDNDQLVAGSGNDILQGNAGDDTLFGEAGDDELRGAGGVDVLSGGDGNDTLFGGGGDDVQIFGGAGADTLTGGTGNDILQGEAGDDVYVFNLGDQRDTIFETSDTILDRVQFGPGITLADLTFSKTEAKLIASHANGTDELTIENWYAGGGNFKVSQFEFDDGTILSGTAAENLGLQLQRGTAGNDFIAGTEGNDTLYGLGGNDQIFGNGGNDLLIGGTGNDILNGGAGTDNFRFELGDGQDRLDGSGFLPEVLTFGAGIASADISYRRIGNDLVMSHVNGTDKVTVAGWYATTNTYELGSVVFESDGTVLTRAQLTTLGTDTNDAYTFSPGGGAVTIEDWGGSDTLTFAAPLTKAEFAPSRVGQDLVLTRTAVPTDTVTVKDWFNDVVKQIENVTFATGGGFTHAELTDPFLTLTGTAGNDTLVGGNAYGEIINGLAGNDTLSGGGGNDLFTGGLGNDILQGGDGVDRYFFRPGDGQDTIGESITALRNVVQFGPGMVNNVVFSFTGNDTLITFTGSTDSVRIVNSSANLVLAKFELNGTNNADTITGSTFGDVIDGLGGNDTINGANGEDEIYGGAGNDTLEGGGTDTDGSTDYLYGGDGDDILDTGFRASTGDVGGFMTGGRGNDQLFGSSGRDSYLFNLGDGVDTATDEPFFGNGQWHFRTDDDVIFGPGITQESISARYSGSDIIVQVTPTDSITLKSWTDIMRRIDILRFADGTSMNDVQIDQLARTIKGTAGNDTLTGTAAGETFLGLGGNDTMTGLGGNDQLTGGTGDDSVQGGDGDDTYFFNLGDGRDVITETSGTDSLRFGAGITASGVTLGRSANSLVLTLDPFTSITINDYVLSSATRIENFIFTDGSQLPSEAQIIDQLLNIRGTTGDDVLTGTSGFDNIFGFEGNDTFNGLGDNDFLFGGPGNDTFQYASGSGADVISDESGFDQLVFAAGITPTSVTTTRNAIDLFLGVAGIPVTVSNYFNGQEVEEIRFSDGTVWNVPTVRARVLTASQTAGSDTVYGYETNDTINSLAGDDTVFAGAGDDIVDGGTGSDTLWGEDGNDVLTAGAGDSGKAVVVNVLRGGNGNDVLNASGKSDQLFGDAGNDILRGGAGINLLDDTGGNNVFDAQAGNDTLRGGSGNDAFIAGAGNDNIDGDPLLTGMRGQDILLHNKGAGTDTAIRLGTGSTLSIGGGMLYRDLTLAVSGNTLTVGTGTGSVALTDWYGGNKAISRLQIVIEGTRDYSATSTNPMNNRKIQTFDFLALVQAFDTARALGQNFNVANNLPTYRLSGSDTDAIGGAIAYQYNRNGAISSITNAQLQTILASSNFGVNPQPISATAPQSLEVSSVSFESEAPILTSFAAEPEPLSLSEPSVDPEPESFAPDTSNPAAGYLERAPRFEFEALSDWLDDGSQAEILDPNEIARRWARVARFAVQENRVPEEARAAALGWQRFADSFAAANAGGTASFQQFVGLGVASGLPSLESFKGLNEGLTRL